MIRGWNGCVLWWILREKVDEFMGLVEGKKPRKIEKRDEKLGGLSPFWGEPPYYFFPLPSLCSSIACFARV